MIHHSKSIDSLQMVPPKTITLSDGRIAISFRDVLYNLLVNQIKGVDYQRFNEKVKKKATKVLSPKHRKRIERQAKRMMRG